jgi:hypothetical protein
MQPEALQERWKVQEEAIAAVEQWRQTELFKKLLVAAQKLIEDHSGDRKRSLQVFVTLASLVSPVN